MRIALILFSLLSYQSAFAYIPPSYFFVRLLSKKHADLKNSALKYKVSFYDSDTATPHSTFNDTIYISDGKISSVLKGTGSEILASSAKSMDEEGSNFSLFTAALFFYHPSKMFHVFKKSGLPIKTEAQVYEDKDSKNPNIPYKPESSVTLTHIQSRLVYIFNGDNGRTISPPQIWFDKSSMLPIRVVFRTADGEALDVRIAHHSVYQNSFLPKVIDVYRGGSLWSKLELLDASALTKHPDIANKIASSIPQADSIESYMKWLH